jgi:hypothetical protein
MSEDAGAGMKMRLRSDLRTAMKERRGFEVSLIRALVAAIDNAEALPLEAVQERGGSSEARRLLLDGQRLRGVLQAEIGEREDAARRFEDLGHMERAELLRAEAHAVRRYLD